MKRKITCYLKSSQESIDRENQGKEQSQVEVAKLSCDFLPIISNFSLKQFNSNNLNVSYGLLFSKEIANTIYALLEKEIVYNEKSEVKIFGKTFETPRKQVAFGDNGFLYRFSGVSVPAKEWLPTLITIRDIVNKVSDNCNYNFVLINRYKDGEDYMGEHQDNEKDLELTAPIASLSFGQSRDFVFRHVSTKQTRRCRNSSTVIENVKFNLAHGSILIMKHPTNTYWYHGLPKRSTRACPLPRINLTFRKIKVN